MLRKMIHTQIGLILICALSAPLSGCISFGDDEETTEESEEEGKLSKKQKEELNKAKKEAAIQASLVAEQRRALEVAARETASLQSKVSSLERSQLKMSGEISLLKRSFRSGLLVPPSGEEIGELDNFDESLAPELDLMGGAFASKDTGFEQWQNSTKQGMGDKKAKTAESNRKTTESPFELLELATASIETRDYAQAVVALQRIKDNHPGFKDEGISDVLLAESWLALNAPDKALRPLERFMSVFPSSAHIPRAKLAAAKSHRKLGETQRGSSLLVEVIALAPNSAEADQARALLSNGGSN